MADVVAESLSSQFPAAADVVLAQGWSDEQRIAMARGNLATNPDPAPSAGRTRISQYLLDQRILTREQAQELDVILRSQANLPGFKLLRKIGSGGMGVVFLAKHLASGRQVALKTLNTRLAEEGDFISRFHREAAAIKGIQHPHIAEVIESGEVDGHCYLAMEFIDGPSAMDLLRDYRALPEVYALRITRQIAEGLALVYAKSGLVHRDIKPENILIMRSRATNGEMFPDDDCAKLIDFGLVKSMKEDDQRLTQTGMTIGTPLYMSPEQVRGEALDCRSDVYGLGATLYHLLTGSTPFTGNSPGSIMSAHLTEPVPDPGAKVPSLSAATRQIVMTSMAKDVGGRFLNHEAVITACDKALVALNGKNDGAPKLLRKPLVLKPPPRRFETPRPGELNAAPQPLPTLPISEPGQDPVSSRIIAKHREKAGTAAPSGGDGKDGTAVTHAVMRAPMSDAFPSSAAAASDPTLDRQIRTRPHLDIPPTPAALATPSSAALDAEARAAAGQAGRVGWLAWAVLAAAIAALVTYLVIR
jgi:serine/threonine-protein kinase